MRERSLGQATLGLLALAVVLRLAAAFALGDRLYFTDEAEYVDAADRLLAGGGFDAHYDRVPAYPVFVAGLRAGPPQRIRTVRVLQAVLAATGAGLAVRLGARTLGSRAALVAGLLYAADPMLVVAGGLLYPEAIAAVLLIMVLLCAVEATECDRIRWSTAAGAGLGLLAQLRPVALVLVPPLALWAATGTSRRVRHAGAVILGCVLLLAPWTYRGYRLHGSLVPIATQGTISAPVPRESVERRGLVGSLVEEAWAEPMSFLRHLTRESGHFFELYPQRLATDNPEDRVEIHARDPRLPLQETLPPGPRNLVSAFTFGPELLLAMVGLVAGWRDHRRVVLLLAGATLCYGFGYALFIGKLRYRIPVLPLLFVLAGHGAVTIFRQLRPDTARSA